jgi:hypothetical protein
MKRHRLVRIALAVAAAAAVVPAANATRYGVPPLDAGTSIPNPVYLAELTGRPLPPIDAGSDQPNPSYAVQLAPQGLPPLDAGTNIPNPVYLRTHDNRVDLPTATQALAQATSSGFDWGDAGIGAGSALGLLFLTGFAVAVTRRNRKSGPLPA